MSWSIADLKRRLKENPDLELENPDALKTHGISDDVRELNPDMPSQQIDAADTLLAYIRTLAPDLPRPIRDYPFDRFRIDLAWPSKLLAVEVDGGQHKPGGGKHGGKRDYQKTRRITQTGWRLLRFTAGEVNDNPQGVIKEIREALQ